LAITAAQMLEKGTLMTLPKLREELSQIEPLHEHIIPTSSQITWEVGEDWNKVTPEEACNVFLQSPGGTRYQLTRQSVIEAAAAARMPRQVTQWMPPNILGDFLNWAYRTGLGDKDHKVLYHPRPGNAEPLILAACRGTPAQFSNLQFLDVIEAGIHKAYGDSAEIYVDSGGRKYASDLERTNLRLVVPEKSRTMGGTRVGDDTWSAGVALTNSLIGVTHPGTSLNAYLFRWWCTNGCTEQLASGGKLNRRVISSEEDAYAWAEHAVNEVLGGLEAAFDSVQALAHMPVGGGQGTENVMVRQVLRDLFSQNNIPQRERNRIIAQMAELGGDLSMYDIQAAITFAANDESISERTADRLLELGGAVAHASSARCDGTLPHGCHQLLPDGFAELAAQSAAGNAN
jgi:hypothetical protein